MPGIRPRSVSVEAATSPAIPRSSSTDADTPWMSTGEPPRRAFTAPMSEVMVPPLQIAVGTGPVMRPHAAPSSSWIPARICASLAGDGCASPEGRRFPTTTAPRDSDVVHSGRLARITITSSDAPPMSATQTGSGSSKAAAALVRARRASRCPSMTSMTSPSSRWTRSTNSCPLDAVRTAAVAMARTASAPWSRVSANSVLSASTEAAMESSARRPVLTSPLASRVWTRSSATIMSASCVSTSATVQRMAFEPMSITAIRCTATSGTREMCLFRRSVPPGTDTV